MKKSEGLTCQESLTDMLTVEKNLVKIYATALTEMSSEANRSLIKKNLTDAAKLNFLRNAKTRFLRNHACH